MDIDGLIRTTARQLQDQQARLDVNMASPADVRDLAQTLKLLLEAQVYTKPIGGLGK